AQLHGTADGEPLRRREQLSFPSGMGVGAGHGEGSGDDRPSVPGLGGALARREAGWPMRRTPAQRGAALLALAAVLALAPVALAGKRYLEWRLVSDRSMRLAPAVPLAGTSEVLTLEQKVFFTEADVESVFVDDDETHTGHFKVAVRMDSRASARFKT